MTPITVDNEITLRLPEVADAEALYSLVMQNRAHLETFLFWVPYYNTLADATKFIRESQENAKNKSGLHLVIVKNEMIVGCIGFVSISGLHDKAEIGFWLSQEHEKQGIVTKSAKALIDFGFKTLGLHRIELLAATGNDKSQKIAEKLGFTKEGCLSGAHKVQGRYLDLYLYSLLAI